VSSRGCSLLVLAHRRQRTIPNEELKAIVVVLAALRKKRGLSQRQLSRQLNMHPMTIMRLELDRRDLTLVEYLEIANALGEDPAVVLAQALRGNSAAADSLKVEPASMESERTQDAGD